MSVLICLSTLVLAFRYQNSSKQYQGVNVWPLTFSKKASKVQLKPAAVISFLNPGFSFFINSHVTSSGVELLFLVTLFYLDIFSTIDCKYYFCQKKVSIHSVF